VGVNRSRPAARTSVQGLPHTRGGEPSDTVGELMVQASSPHAWG